MCAADPLVELEKDLQRYLGFQRSRVGREDMTFADALREHRRQVLENLRDDGDELWLLRNGWLEKLADQRGIDLTAEPQLKDVIGSHRARRGRTETLW